MILNTISSEQVFGDAFSFIQNPPKGFQIPEWKIFSEMIGGLREKEFTIFCGATGSGKTQFLATLARNISLQEKKVFVASVETGAIDFAVRVLSAHAGYDFNAGEKFPIDAIRKIVSSTELDLQKFINNMIFSKHENRVDVQEMIETLKYMHDMNGIEYAILDNINFFLKPTSANNALLEMDSAVHEFVMLAKEIPIHLFLVMHPRKTEDGKVKSEFDIKGSSTAVQEATNVLLMNRMNDSEINYSPLKREFIFVKIRKRGYNVGKKFYMEYNGGRYVESNCGSGKAPNVIRAKVGSLPFVD